MLLWWSTKFLSTWNPAVGLWAVVTNSIFNGCQLKPYCHHAWSCLYSQQLQTKHLNWLQPVPDHVRAAECVGMDICLQDFVHKIFVSLKSSFSPSVSTCRYHPCLTGIAPSKEIRTFAVVTESKLPSQENRLKVFLEF